MKEIEILVEVVESKQKALKILDQFEYKGIKKTLDIYFHDPLRKDLYPDVSGRLNASFRIRQKAGINSFAYKTDHFIDEKWSHSDEFETVINDFDITLQIIEKLGLKELIRIDNEKHTFVSSDYEIVLEDVKDLGLFIEVEKLIQVSDDKVMETKEEIRLFLKNLDLLLGEEQNAGKPELMLKRKG